MSFFLDEFEDLESTAQGTLRRLSSSRSMFYVTLDPAENSVSLCKNEESSSSFDSAVPSSRGS